jgi:hypothetical protein
LYDAQVEVLHNVVCIVLIPEFPAKKPEKLTVDLAQNLDGCRIQTPQRPPSPPFV